MRWIEDADKDRLIQARKHADCESVTAVLLDTVLENMASLEKEQPHPEPRVAALSESERRKIYPERY
jgi:L-amino acid N-acyltransferase YncA